MLVGQQVCAGAGSLEGVSGTTSASMGVLLTRLSHRPPLRCAATVSIASTAYWKPVLTSRGQADPPACASVVTDSQKPPMAVTSAA